MRPITLYLGTSRHLESITPEALSPGELNHLGNRGIALQTQREHADRMRELRQTCEHRYSTGTNHPDLKNPLDLAEFAMCNHVFHQEHDWRTRGVLHLRRNIERIARETSASDGRLPTYEAAIALIEDGTARVPSEGGYLYTAELSVEPDQLLLWEQPLAQQPALLALLKGDLGHLKDSSGKITGAHFYRYVADHGFDGTRAWRGDYQGTNNLLHGHGIAGIRQINRPIQCFRVGLGDGDDAANVRGWVGREMLTGHVVVPECRTHNEALERIAEAEGTRYTLFSGDNLRVVNTEAVPRTFPSSLRAATDAARYVNAPQESTSTSGISTAL